MKTKQSSLNTFFFSSEIDDEVECVLTHQALLTYSHESNTDD